MENRALHLAAAVLFGSSLVPWLGCGRDNDKLQGDLHKAGQELNKDAHNLGQAVQKGARDLDQRIGPVARETLGDAALTARVKARLIAAPDLGGIRIHVTSRNGEVTLEGTVGSGENRADAEKITRRTEGVREVIDHLQVGATG